VLDCYLGTLIAHGCTLVGGGNDVALAHVTGFSANNPADTEAPGPRGVLHLSGCQLQNARQHAVLAETPGDGWVPSVHVVDCVISDANTGDEATAATIKLNDVNAAVVRGNVISGVNLPTHWLEATSNTRGFVDGNQVPDGVGMLATGRLITGQNLHKRGDLRLERAFPLTTTPDAWLNVCVLRMEDTAKGAFVGAVAISQSAFVAEPVSMRWFLSRELAGPWSVVEVPNQCWAPGALTMQWVAGAEDDERRLQIKQTGGAAYAIDVRVGVDRQSWTTWLEEAA
jgi:hypothetical protein